MSSLPSQERLSDLLEYDAETGALIWRERRWIDARGRAKAFRHGGKRAGHLRRDGKFVIGIDGKLHLAHRVIWVLVHGEEPVCLDHINGDPADNRLTNLRNGTQADNNRNVARRSDNSSGRSGVSYRADRRRWRAYICGRSIGSFATKEDAIAARIVAQAGRGFSERHGG